MKKITALFLCCICAIGILCACTKDNNTNSDVKSTQNINEESGDDTKINVMLVDGAPLISMTHMMAGESGGLNTGNLAGYDISYNMTNDVDLIVAALLNGEPDFAIAPINVAAMMYNNGSGYAIAAVTIWGIMNIVSDQDVATLEELKGETIVAFGKSGTPGITLRAVLRQNNIDFVEPESTDFIPDPDKVNIVYLTAASDVRDAIATGMELGGKPVSFGLLAEPVATAVTGFANNAGRAGFMPRINLQDEWAKNNNGEIYPQAALIFHERLLEENSNFVDSFVTMVELSSNYANANIEETGDLAVSLGSVAIPNGAVVANAYNAGRLPINFTYAPNARAAVDTYLQILMAENPNLIGGKMPSDEFYYAKK